MTQEDKELLFKDLCARLLYGVICKVEFKDSEGWKTQNMSLEGVFINECYFTTDTGSIYSKCLHCILNNSIFSSIVLLLVAIAIIN